MQNVMRTTGVTPNGGPFAQHDVGVPIVLFVAEDHSELSSLFVDRLRADGFEIVSTEDGLRAPDGDEPPGCASCSCQDGGLPATADDAAPFCDSCLERSHLGESPELYVDLGGEG